MITNKLVSFENQENITSMSNAFVFDADNNNNVSVACVLTSGSPAVGASIEITLDSMQAIEADTATWIASTMGNHSSDGVENILMPVTGIRLNVADGTWELKILQAQ